MAASGVELQRTASVRERQPVKLGTVLAWAFLGLMLLLTLFPLWWVVRTGFSNSHLIFKNTTSLLPVDFTLLNFARVLGLVDTKTALAAGGSGQKFLFLRYLWNSLTFSTLNVAGQLFFSSLAAYVFARLRFPGRDKIFFLYVLAMMVPGVVLLIPNFVLVKSLGWLNTYAGMLAPTFLMTPFAVFFLRQFFLSFPRDIEEAAWLDGAGTFAVFWRFAIPMSMPALATLATLIFMESWNSYLWPLLTAPREDMRVLVVGLAIFQSQTPQGSPDWTGLMAGTALAIVPTLVLFLIMGRRVINSIQFSGIK